jgi:hypothetical protein
MTDLGKMYRYDITTYAGMYDDLSGTYGNSQVTVQLKTYDIIKITKCGVWIDYMSYNSNGNKKFINTNSTKQFACKSEELAKISFIKRKTRQISILQSQIDQAEAALDLITERGFFK